MKKKILSILISVFAICTFMFTLSACGGGEPPHTHVYDQQVVNDTFKASNATCEDKATYFYSCSCGEGGLETFEVGEALGHAYSNWASNGNNTHSKTCANDNTHIITEDCSGGTPTETQRPVCKDCHAEYGESLGHIHTLHLTKVDAKPQSCTKEGNIEYYTCSCGKWYTDNTATTEITDKTSVVIEKDDHEYETLKKTATQHWYECSCGAYEIKENHIPGAEATETTDQKCTVCEYVITPALGHVHTLHLTKVEAKPQSCTATGNIEYYTCSCGNWFTDNTATTEITDKTSVVIAKDKHNHNILKYNETEHWYECSCGDRATAEEHKGGTATCQVKATCSVCGEKYGTIGSHQPKTEWVTTETHHYHECKTSACTEKLNYGEHNFDNNKKCVGCDYVTTALLGTEISSNAYEISGTNLFVKVPNAQTTFSFAKTINVAKGATYKVYTDISCKEEYCIPSYVVNDLKEENNVYYFLVSNGDEIPQVYTVTVRRRPKYTVTFNTDGGSYVAPQTIEEDALAVKPNNPTKTGYDFVSWDYDFNTAITGNKTIKASWSINQYTITFVLNNGKENVVVKQNYNTSITAPVPTKFGHTFTAWDKSVPSKMPAENMTITANWKINQYSITIVYGNGQGNKIITQDYNYNVEEIDIPERLGYIFDGWDKSIPSKMPAEDITITAQWELATYSIVYDLNDGEFVEYLNPTTYTIETDEISLMSPRRKNYGFLGWYIDNEKVERISKGMYGDLFLEAKWEYAFIITNGNTLTGVTSYAKTTCFKMAIPSTIKFINKGALNGCSVLTEISLPFIGQSNSRTLGSKQQEPFGIVFGENSYNNSIKTTQICLNNSGSAYSQTYFIPKSLEKVEITKGWLHYGAFYNCANIKSITMSSTSEKIGDKAFYACSALENIEIPNRVTSIGCGAFEGCSSLTSIEIPDSVTSIDAFAFSDCDSLTSVIFEENSQLTSIGNSAFSNCDSLESIEIPASVTSIGSWAFYNCRLLRSVIITNSVESIGAHAFSICGKLTKVYYRGTAEDWAKMNIDTDNTNLTNATKYYYIENQEDVPTDGGNYWHYDENGNRTIW